MFLHEIDLSSAHPLRIYSCRVYSIMWKSALLFESRTLIPSRYSLVSSHLDCIISYIQIQRTYFFSTVYFHFPRLLFACFISHLFSYFLLHDIFCYFMVVELCADFFHVFFSTFQWCLLFET